MWTFGITRMCVGLRGAMSRNARTSSSSTTVFAATSPRTMRQNRQSARGERSGGMGDDSDGLRRAGQGEDAADDAVANRGVDPLDGDAGDDILEVVAGGRRIDRD